MTHDYEQVEKYTTRHIKMHDGEVVEDKLIKAIDKNEIVEEPKLNPMSLATVLLFAFRNILSMPRRFIFFILLQIMIILVFTFSYTNLMITARNQNFGGGFGNIPQNDFFDFYSDKISDNRMNVVKKDGSAMNQSDFDYFNGLNDILHVYKNTTTMDNHLIQYADMEIQPNFSRSIFDFNFDSTLTIFDSPQFLIGGSLNNLDADEVIVSNAFNDAKVGNKVRFEMYEKVNYDYVAVEQSYGVYTWPFHDANYVEHLVTLTFISNAEPMTFYHWANTLDLYNDYGLSNAMIDDLESVEVKVLVEDYTYQVYTIAGIYNDNFRSTIYFPHDVLEVHTYGQTMSLISNNKISGERLFNSINKDVYRVIYPELNKDAIQQLFAPINFLLSLFYYILIYFFAIFLYFILFSVMRNVMNSRKKDFAIFRSIGANESKLGILVIFEQVIMMIVSFIISMTILSIIRYYDFSTNFVMEQLLLIDYVILFFTFTYLSIWLARKFNKKTFKFSVIENITESKEEGL